MFDTEELITEVEQRPCVWNISHRSYSDKPFKRKAWQEIAENCFEEWNNFTNEEKQNKLNVLQKKWKSVRDYYIREKKKEGRSRSAAKKRKLCPYFDLLEFLKRTKHSKIRSSNLTSPESMNEDSNLTKSSNDEDSGEQFKPTATQPSVSQAPTSMQTVSMPPVYQSQPSTLKQATSSQPSVSRAYKLKMTSFEECLLKKFDNNDDDPNRHFLLSLLPEMLKMTERQNFDFRMEVMLALNEVKYQIPDTTMNEDSNLTKNSNDKAFGKQCEPTATQPSVSQAPTSMETVSMPPVCQSQSSTSKQAMSSQPSVSRAYKPKMTPLEECLLKKFDDNDDNPNRHFLLSLLPEMLKMTERQNFDFRMEVMEALNEVKYQIPDPTINTNWPCFLSPGSYRNQYSPSPVNRGYTTPSMNSRNKVYRSKWYAYTHFQFMAKKNNPGDTQDTIEDDEMHYDEPETDIVLKQEPLSEEDEEGTQTQQLLQQNCKERKRKLNNEVEEEDERLNPPTVLEQCVESPTDGYHTFGQHIANELRKYDPITLAHVKHAINNIIFEADTGIFPGPNPENFSRSARKRFTSLPMTSPSKKKSTSRS